MVRVKMNASCPTSPEPTDKAKKYDRQLRLWDDHGQAALEASHVCLINATGTGTELLKSLILPGVGRFTILDNKLVTAEDLGSNFFLNEESIGRNRGEMACALLLELNSDVSGNFIDDSVEQLLANTPSFFDEFQLVIANDLPEKALCELSERLWKIGVPLILCRSFGFFGYLRIQFREHTVIESHPDNALEDLRLLNPFPTLMAHMDAIDLDSLTPRRLCHVPYPIIIHKYLAEYRNLHEDGGNPTTRVEKRDFQALLRRAKAEIVKRGIQLQKEKDGDVGDGETGSTAIAVAGIDAENYEEAAKAVNTALSPTGVVTGELEKILNDPSCLNLTPQSSTFWVLCRALKEFISTEDCLPVRGALPDMTSDSDSYVVLQKIYKERASRDADVIGRKARQLLKDLGRNPESISDQEIRLFCRNASFLRILRGSSVANEYSKFPRLPGLSSELESGDSDLTLYVMLRAVERFRTDFGRYPGVLDGQLETDNHQLKACVSKLLSEGGTPVSVGDDFVQEMTRYGAAELHSVAAFVGGCGAQEAIKLLTRQYVPVDNTMVYNALTSKCATYKM